MTFLVREHSGITRKLLCYLTSTLDANMSAVVDGPYGSYHRRYEDCSDEVILVAGGNGVTAVLPLLLYLARSIGHSSLQAIKFVWTVRCAEHIELVRAELHEALATVPKDSISLDVYATDDDEGTSKLRAQRREESRDIAEAYKASSSISRHFDGLWVTHFSGRPNLGTVIPELVGVGRTAIIGCGPERLKIDLSNAAMKLQGRVLKGEAKEVTLHIEAFDW